MSFIAQIRRAREVLSEEHRLSERALVRELGIAGDALWEVIEVLVDIQRVARRMGELGAKTPW